MDLKDIQDKPQVVDNIHESVYRSYHILKQVLEMVERGDSKETIFELVDLLESNQRIAARKGTN